MVGKVVHTMKKDHEKTPRRKLRNISKYLVLSYGLKVLTPEDIFNYYIDSDLYKSVYERWQESGFKTPKAPAFKFITEPSQDSSLKDFILSTKENCEGQKKQKRQETNLKRYGTTEVLASKEVRSRIEEDNLKNHGVRHVSQTQDWKDTVREVMLDKYGVTSPNQIPEVKEKTRLTNLKRYGVENPLQNKKILAKQHHTMMERHGVEIASQHQDYKEKVKKTSLLKRGVDSHFKDPEVRAKIDKTRMNNFGTTRIWEDAGIQEKKRKTNIERYGSETPLESDIVQDKIKITNKKNLGVDYPLQSKEVRKKIETTFQENYSSNSPLTDPAVREKVRTTNLELYGTEFPSETDLIKKKTLQSNLKKYGVENPSQLDEVKNKSKLTRIAKGLQMVLPDELSIKDFSKIVGFSYTTCLNILKEVGYEESKRLLSNQLRVNSRLEVISSTLFDLTNYNKVLPIINSRPDFQITEDLYLDVDGLYYHSELIQQDKSYHLLKRKKYESIGKQIIQFREDEIKFKSDIVSSMVNSFLNRNIVSINARSCEFKEVDSQTANAFLVKNHLQGSGKTSKYRGALFYKGEIVQLMTLSSNFKRTKDELHLDRFCTALNTRVRGGFSKLLSKSLTYAKESNYTKIISFCDLRYSQGKVYESNGFNLVSESLSWGWTNLKNVYHRLTFHKNKEGYDSGFYKIYDAGQRKYELTI